MADNQIEMVLKLPGKQFNNPRNFNTVAVTPDVLIEKYPAIVKLWHLYWQGWFTSPHKHYRVIRNSKLLIIALHEGSGGGALESELNLKPIAGFTALMETTSRDPWISLEEVMVAPSWQDHDIGTVLVNRAISECESMQLPSISLTCARDKVGYYEKFGFRMTNPNAP